MAQSLAFNTPARVGTMTTAASADWTTFLARLSRGQTVFECPAGDAVFIQGEPADSLFFLLQGKIKLVVGSREGKEAIVATRGPGEFIGEACLAGQTAHTAAAISVGDSILAEVKKPVMARMLADEPGLASLFINRLLSRIIRYEADLVDQLFNSSERRLARMLLLLSQFGNESKVETVAAGISQEHLAQMVGTTRSRINRFMTKFRTLGFIDYNGEAGVTVHRGLLTVVRGDQSVSMDMAS